MAGRNGILMRELDEEIRQRSAFIREEDKNVVIRAKHLHLEPDEVVSCIKRVNGLIITTRQRAKARNGYG